MILTFTAAIIHWRGPAPFLFAPMPEDESQDVKAIASRLTYGWGVIPVRAQLGATAWQTSLFPKDGRYLVPIKVLVQKAEAVGEGDVVTITLTLALDAADDP